MSRVLKFIGECGRRADFVAELRIAKIDIYNNRPDKDRNSLAHRAADLVKNHNAVPHLAGKGQLGILYGIDSQETGYSGIHFILEARIQKNQPDSSGARSSARSKSGISLWKRGARFRMRYPMVKRTGQTTQWSPWLDRN